jgi:hypothetical protein
VLEEASEMISGLSHCAGLVVSEKQVGRLKHIEFVLLEPGKALVILVGDDNSIENRIVDLPAGLPSSALVEASNYLNANLRGRTLAQAKQLIEQQLAEQKAELDALTQALITAGLAEWSGTLDDRRSLIVHGRSNLLKDVKADDELERIRQLFDDLESKNDVVQLLGLPLHEPCFGGDFRVDVGLRLGRAALGTGTGRRRGGLFCAGCRGLGPIAVRRLGLHALGRSWVAHDNPYGSIARCLAPPWPANAYAHGRSAGSSTVGPDGARRS